MSLAELKQSVEPLISERERFNAWFREEHATLAREQKAAHTPRLALIATKGTMDWAYPPFILGSTAAAMGWWYPYFSVFMAWNYSRKICV